MLMMTLMSLMAAQASPTEAWLRQQATPAGIHQSISHYHNLENPFPQQITPWLRRRISFLASSAQSKFLSGQCKDSTYFKVFTADSVPFQTQGIEKTFVNSVFRIESAYCIQNSTVDKVFSTFMSSEYRLDVMPRLGQYSYDGHETCIGTEAVHGVLKPSRYCMAVNTLTRDKSIVSHSILKKSEFNSDYQPVYYREEVLVIAQVSEKTTGIYRVTFTRSDDLGMASKFLIQSTVDSSQESIYKGLERWLNQ